MFWNSPVTAAASENWHSPRQITLARRARPMSARGTARRLQKPARFSAHVLEDVTSEPKPVTSPFPTVLQPPRISGVEVSVVHIAKEGAAGGGAGMVLTALCVLLAVVMV
eukprot:TRINITY_DN3961_c0_g1_i1.p2 TRINITY_DN3961_c0_g1~~TRINITY_DN3961_c0_g1_i1.p2  ORF type:complete len:126 (+),score=7.33 TRINITY_DN3961_c0_g1_i1:51-380(+)